MWPVYVINMRDQHARMEAAATQLDCLSVPFLRFEAVNGRTLDTEKVEAVYDSNANRKRFRHQLVAGEIGVYLSHLALWSKVAQADAPGAIIFEDDFVADESLPCALSTLCCDEDDWDMVKLYSRKPGRKVVSERFLENGMGLVVPWQVPTSTIGYLIRKDAASRLLSQRERFFRPVDEDLRWVWEHQLDIRLLRPPPLDQGGEAKAANSVESARKSTGRNSLSQGWKNLKYRVHYLTRLFFYRLLGF